MFELQAPVPAEDLVGTRWQLDTLIRGDTASTVRGDPATLLLHADGTLEGSTGCRKLTGRYVLHGDQINATDFAADGECPGELFDQDNHIVAVLGDGFRALVDGQRLTLTSDGGIGLGYVGGHSR
jgi:heat shock protein HslJ